MPKSYASTITQVLTKLLTGYVSGAGTVAATDSILQAIQKLSGNYTNLERGLLLNNTAIQLIQPTPLSTNLVTPGITFSTVGTVTARQCLSTSYLTQQVRVYYASAATAGSVACLYSNNNSLWIGNAAGKGGFFAILRFGFGIKVTDMRVFVGLVNNSFSTNLEPSSQADMIGVGKDGADTNFQIMYNDSSGTATKVDTGIAPDTTSGYEVKILCLSNASSVDITFTNLATAGTFTSSPSTNLPANTVFLKINLIATNNATATAINLDIIKVFTKALT